MAKTPLGRLPREAIRMLDLPRPPQDILEGYRRLVDLTGTVQICGVPVRPGDLVCADDAGVAFVPRERAAPVLETARKIDAGDTKRKADIDKGTAISELLTRKYK